MSEKGLLGGFEHWGHGLVELFVGIGAVALGIRFFKDSFGHNQKKNKPES